MRGKETKRQTRLYLISALILLVGLSSAVLIYATSGDDDGDAVGYDVAGERSYAVSPQSSKKYIHELERFGGKASVLADGFNRWFDGLWHGTSLAYTIACLTILTSAGFFLAARIEVHDPPSDAVDKSDRTETYRHL
jgi:hypothetical protein